MFEFKKIIFKVNCGVICFFLIKEQHPAVYRFLFVLLLQFLFYCILQFIYFLYIIITCLHDALCRILLKHFLLPYLPSKGIHYTLYNVIKTIILLNFRFSCLPLLHSNGSFSNRLLHRMPLNKICSRYVHRGNKIVHLKGTVS